MTKKEIISKKTIIKEVSHCCYKDILEISFLVIASILLLLVTTFLFNKLSLDFFKYLFIVVYSFTILLCVLSIINLVKILIRAQKGNFEIKKDAVASKKEILDRFGGYALKTHIWAYTRRRFRLFFYEHGEYALRRGYNYLTSQTNHLDEKLLFERYSDIGEEFYLIIFDKKRPPFIAYNTRLFEFIDNIED